MSDTDFFVTVFSNNSLNIYSNNVQSNFTNSLQKCLKLTGDWVVGISEIFLNELNMDSNFSRKTIIASDPASVSPSKHFFMNTQARSQNEDSKNKEINKETEGLIINNFQILEMIFPLIGSIESLINHLKIKKEKHNVVGHIFVYSDIIKPRLFGSQFIRCLRVLPVNGSQQHIKFDRIEYSPIEISSIPSISLLIADDLGRKVDFKASSTPIFCTLHFKKLGTI